MAHKKRTRHGRGLRPHADPDQETLDRVERMLDVLLGQVKLLAAVVGRGLLWLVCLPFEKRPEGKPRTRAKAPRKTESS